MDADPSHQHIVTEQVASLVRQLRKLAHTPRDLLVIVDKLGDHLASRLVGRIIVDDRQLAE